MANCEGCEALCPAILAAAEQEAVLVQEQGALEARAAERQETADRWDAVLAAASPAERVEERFIDGDPVGNMYAASDLSDMFARNQERADHRRETRVAASLATLGSKVEARQTHCEKGPRTTRTLGIVGAKRVVCQSDITDDGLPNRSS